MRTILLVFFIIVAGCINPQKQVSQTSLAQKMPEEFSYFYSKFYSDTNFQNKRILKPLRGVILGWVGDSVKEESWDNKKITVSSKEKFLNVYRNLKTELIKKDSVVIEKYWIEQSGFFVEKKFILKSGKWYLHSYNISNL